MNRWVIIAAALCFAMCIFAHGMANAQEEQATVITGGINGTTAYLVYKAGGNVYLYERSGYGKPEQREVDWYEG